MPFRTARLALVLVPLALAGCSSSQVMAPAMPTTHEGLHATLWVQTAAEYHALALQTFTTARHQLDAALDDTRMSADPDQLRAGSYEDLPPAIVLDVDETVLDNSAYQARLIRDGAAYDRETWNAWVREATAAPVPGALEFIEYAASRGVAVVYLTNRRSEIEAPTRRNLTAAGFPIAEDFDAVLTRGEIDEGSDKGSRRALVTAQFRVLQYLGDNLGDFLSDIDTTVPARDREVLAYADWWGERWFMLPNPQYGSWESVLFDNDYSLTPEARAQRKVGRLEMTSSPTQ